MKKQEKKRLSFANRLMIGVGIKVIDNLIVGLRSRKDEVYSSMNDDFRIGYNTCINDLESVKTEMNMIKGDK